MAVSKTATPLPDPLPALAKSKYKVKFGRGQLCMFAGSPGAGKTTAALIMAIKANVPTLYFSADSDETTMAARAACVVTGHPYGTVSESQAVGVYGELYGERIAELPIRFVFDPSQLTIEDIGNAITAYVELWGVPPHLIVIDNLWNMSTEGEEWSALRSIVKDLHWMARRTKACVWLLHHTSEQDPRWITSAPPRGAIQGKLSQLPVLVLTLGNDEGVLYVAVVKNRHGPSDPHAKQPVRMIIDFVTMKLDDTPMMGGVAYGGYGWQDHKGNITWKSSPGGSENVPHISGSGGKDNWSPSRAVSLDEGRQGVIPGVAA